MCFPRYYYPQERLFRWRMVTDYRALNKAMVKKCYPLPHIDDLLDHLRSAK